MSRRPVDADEPRLVDPEEGFLGRWSRRKQAASPPPDQTGQPDPDQQPETGEDPEPILTDADMPAITSIHQDSDVSAFFSSGVSEELRNKALRKMFLSAAFNVPDGLDDYDEDFTRFEKLGDIVTADMRHQMEMEEERRKLAQQDAPEPQDAQSLTDAESAVELTETDDEAGDEQPDAQAKPAETAAVDSDLPASATNHPNGEEETVT